MECRLASRRQREKLEERRREKLEELIAKSADLSSESTQFRASSKKSKGVFGGLFSGPKLFGGGNQCETGASAPKISIEDCMSSAVLCDLASDREGRPEKNRFLSNLDVVPKELQHNNQQDTNQHTNQHTDDRVSENSERPAPGRSITGVSHALGHLNGG